MFIIHILQTMAKRIAGYQTRLAATGDKDVKAKHQNDLDAAKHRVTVYQTQLRELESQKAAIIERFQEERDVYLQHKTADDSNPESLD